MIFRTPDLNRLVGFRPQQVREWWMGQYSDFVSFILVSSIAGGYQMVGESERGHARLRRSSGRGLFVVKEHCCFE